ncbi:hypothetical protein VC87395_001352 [Vibrio paracholerae 87395]|nr:hypothetical protein VCHE09_1069 [Vibrio paracholerae HE-09]EMP93347.1 hypothetical protein VC87395_001352 [Vibrio paracholerae 87395]
MSQQVISALSELMAYFNVSKQGLPCLLISAYRTASFRSW